MKYAKKSNRKGLFIGIAVCLVVLLAVIIAVICAAGGSSDQVPSTEPTTESTPADPAGSTNASTQASEQTESTESESSVDTQTTEETETTDPADSTESTDPTETTEPAETTKPTEPTEPAETTKPTTPTQEDVVIQTPYASLTYPGEWAAFLRTEIKETNGYQVEFHADLESGKTQRLFSLTFGGSGSNPIGAVTASNGSKVNVYLTMDTFTPDNSWTDSEITVVFSMQEALNQVLEKLPLEKVQDSTQNTEPSGGSAQNPEQEDMALDTPYGELHFPSRWSENLLIEVDETNGYSVNFYAKFGSHEKQLLFTIHFGGTQGAFFGQAKDVNGNTVEVRISVYELSLDSSWTNEETSLIYAMQEDLNYLLDRLG